MTIPETDGPGPRRWIRRLRSMPEVTPDAPAHRSFTALRLYRVSTWAAAAGAVLGGVALLGYVLDTNWMESIAPGLPAMAPNTAVALVATGGAILAARRGRAGRTIAITTVVLVIAGSIAELVLNVAEADATWLEGLFRSKLTDTTTAVPGRPVAETCLAMLFLATSTALLQLRRAAVAGQVLGVAAASVGLSAVLGYALDPNGMGIRESSVLVGMAFTSATGVLLLGIAAVMSRPTVGVIGQLLGGGVAGALSRRMAAVIAAAPPALLLAGAVIYRLSPTTEFAQATFSVLQIAAFGALVLVPASFVARTEVELREQLLAARRDSEVADDVDTLVAAIGADAIAQPDLPGWDAAVHFSPAWGHLGGDALMALHHEDRDVLVALDIAGHDARAAVLAYAVRAHIAALFEQHATLDAIVRSTNAKLIRRGTIATAVFIEIAAGTGHLRVANAGHPPPLLLRGRTVERLERTRPVLGLPADDAPPGEVTMGVGDLLLVFTDGIDDARAEGGDFLGDQIDSVVVPRRDEPVADVADGLVDAALQHAGGRLPDDVLVFVLRRTG